MPATSTYKRPICTIKWQHWTICPIDLRAGMIGGQWTPRAAKTSFIRGSKFNALRMGEAV
jgi:hypothetical protein